MKYLILFCFLAITIFSACKDDQPAEPQGDYLTDNIFGCSQFEAMDTEETFFNNVSTPVEVFRQFFVYGGTKNLVVRDGFNGPVLQTTAMSVNNLAVLENQLMICAEEGVFSMNPSGELSTISDYRCHTMVLDGEGRLLLQGDFGPLQGATTFHIQEFKDGVITPFAPVAPSVRCVTYELTAGETASLFAKSCFDEIVYYEDGVVLGEYPPEETPFFTSSAFPLLTAYYDGGLIVMAQSALDYFGIYKLTTQGWQPLYDLTYDESVTEKALETFLHLENNILLHDDYLYGFSVGSPMRGNGIIRYDIAGEDQKTLDDIQLIELPGLSSRDIIDIVVARDGSAYAIMNSRKIIKLTC